MQGDDLLLGETCVLGNKGQVGAKSAAIADRDRDEPAGLRCIGCAGGCGQLLQGGGDGIIVRHKRVVGDHQRSKGGHSLAHAGDGRCLHAGVQRRHRCADLGRDALFKNSQQGAVPYRV